MVIGNPILIGGSGGGGFSPSDEGKVVSNGALVAQGSQTITQNGTYDTTLKNEVVVNVEGGGGGSSISTDFSVEKTIPTMTSNTTPSGVASASSFINSSFDAFHAFDGVNTNAQMQNGWLATASDNAPYIQYLFDAKHKFSLLFLALGNNGPTVSRNVTIQGRKSDGTWENCLATGSEVQLEFTSGKYGANCEKYNIALNGNEYDGLRITGNASFYGGINQYACTFDEIQVYEANGLTGVGYYGVEVPDSSFGENGNIYVNIMTKEIYQKNNGAWAQISM